MTRREYTPADLATLALPALPGLLDVGCPVEMDWHADDDPPRVVSGHVYRVLPAEYGDGRVLWYCDDRSIGSDNCATMFLRLPLSRPEARFRVACWLAEGQTCTRCRASGITATVDGDAMDCDCGDGYLRPPAPLWWALSEPGPGTLPAWVGASMLHVSALRVAAGMSPPRLFRREGSGWDGDDASFGYLYRDDEAHRLLRDGVAALLEGDVLTVEVPAAEALAAGGGR